MKVQAINSRTHVVGEDTIHVSRVGVTLVHTLRGVVLIARPSLRLHRRTTPRSGRK